MNEIGRMLLIVGGVLLVAITYLAVNLATDVAYAWLDPRIRYQRSG